MSWTEEQREIVDNHLKSRATEGERQNTFGRIGTIIFDGPWASGIRDIEVIAIIAGFGKQTFDTTGFLILLQQPKKNA